MKLKQEDFSLNAFVLLKLLAQYQNTKFNQVYYVFNSQIIKKFKIYCV